MFCYRCVEYFKLDTCAKFHDHGSNNNNVMMLGPHATPPPPPPPPLLMVQKKPMSNRVKKQYAIVFLLFGNLKIPKQGIEMNFFS